MRLVAQMGTWPGTGEVKRLTWHPNQRADRSTGHKQHPARQLAAGGPRGGPQRAGPRNLYASASPLGLVMLSMAQGNKIWFCLEEEKCEADPSVGSEAKKPREILKAHVKADSGGKTPPGWEKMLVSLACLVYKPVDFKAPKHGIVLPAGWQHTALRAVSF